jgi:type I restriction enzyme S subunit
MSDGNGQAVRLPHGWRSIKLGDVAEVIRGVGYKKDQSAMEPQCDSVPLLRSGNVQADLDLENKLVYVPRKLVRDDQMLRRGDVIVSVSNSKELVGKAASLSDDWLGTFGAFLGVVRPTTDRIDPAYLGYYFQSPTYRARIAQLSAATNNIANIRKSHLLDLALALPPLDKQRRLVGAIEHWLDAMRPGRTGLRHALEQVDLYETSVLAAAFQGTLVEPSRVVDDASNLLDDLGIESLRESDALPPSWALARFAEVAQHVLGKMLDKQKNRGALRPYLRNSNVRWGHFDLAHVKEMKIEERERERFQVRHGDLLVCEGGEPGRCSVWRGDQEIYFQKALHRVRPGPAVTAEFLACYLRYASRLRLLDSHFTGTTIRHLPGVRLAELAVPLPPLAEQKRIVASVEQQLAKAEQLNEDLQHRLTDSLALEKSVIQQAMVGQLADPA